MAGQKAQRPQTITDRIRQSLKNTNELYALQRIRQGPQQIAVGGIVGVASSDGGSQAGSGNFLKTRGDTMIGPIAFNPALVNFSSDTIDVGEDLEDDSTQAYSTYVLATPQSDPDDLESILGAGFAGQMIKLQFSQAASAVVNVEDSSNNASGNIITPDGNDIAVTGPQIIELVFDITASPNGNNGGWRVTSAVALSGGGGVSFPIEPTITDNSDTWTGTQTLDLDTGDGHVYKWTVDQDLTFASSVSNIPSSGTQRTFELEFEHDNVGGTFTVTLPNNFKDEKGNTLASFTIANGNTVLLSCRVNDGTNFLVFRKNVTATEAVTTALDDLTDVVITGAVKGDMLVYDGSDWVDLAVGSNNQVLTADSAETTGIKWGTNAADNLGDHTATQNLDLGGFDIIDVGSETDAAAGAIRIGNNEKIAWRNAANNDDAWILFDSADDFEINIAGGAQLTISETTVDVEGNAIANTGDIDPSTSTQTIGAGTAYSEVHSDRFVTTTAAVSGSLEGLFQNSTDVFLNVATNGSISLRENGTQKIVADFFGTEDISFKNLILDIEGSAGTDFLKLSHNGTHSILNASTQTSGVDGMEFQLAGNTRLRIQDKGASTDQLEFTSLDIDMNANNINDVNDIDSDSSGNISGFVNVDAENFRYESDPTNIQIAFAATGITMKAEGSGDDITIQADDQIILNSTGAAGDELTVGQGTLQLGATAATTQVNIAGRVTADIIIDNGSVIKSNDATEIGYQVTNDSLTVGGFGTMQIPTDTGSAGTAAQADTDFGNGVGCMGIYLSSGGNPVLCFREADGDWATEILTGGDLT